MKGIIIRGGSRTAVASKVDRFVIIVNDWKLLTIITKRSILDVAAVLVPHLIILTKFYQFNHEVNILDIKLSLLLGFLNLVLICLFNTHLTQFFPILAQYFLPLLIYLTCPQGHWVLGVLICP